MNKGRRLTDEVINRIKELRWQGYRIRYICKELGVSKNTVLKYGKRVRENDRLDVG